MVMDPLVYCSTAEKGVKRFYMTSKVSASVFFPKGQHMTTP